MFQKIAKHRANDASNDVHRPPLLGGSPLSPPCWLWTPPSALDLFSFSEQNSPPDCLQVRPPPQLQLEQWLPKSLPRTELPPIRIHQHPTMTDCQPSWWDRTQRLFPPFHKSYPTRWLKFSHWTTSSAVKSLIFSNDHRQYQCLRENKRSDFTMLYCLRLKILTKSITHCKDVSCCSCARGVLLKGHFGCKRLYKACWREKFKSSPRYTHFIRPHISILHTSMISKSLLLGDKSTRQRRIAKTARSQSFIIMFLLSSILVFSRSAFILAISRAKWLSLSFMASRCFILNLSMWWYWSQQLKKKAFLFLMVKWRR